MRFRIAVILFALALMSVPVVAYSANATSIAFSNVSIVNGTVSGNVALFGSTAKTTEYINRFDTDATANAPCDVSNNYGLVSYPLGTPAVNWNATQKWIRATGSPGGASMIGDGCGGSGYKWDADVSMQFDFTWRAKLLSADYTEVYIGFSSKSSGASTALIGPHLHFTAQSNGTLLVRTEYTNATNNIGQYIFNAINWNAWYHATISYSALTQTTTYAIANVGTWTIAGSTWSAFVATSNWLDGTSVYVPAQGSGPYVGLLLVDNMTSAHRIAGTWTSEPLLSDGLSQMNLTYRYSFLGNKSGGFPGFGLWGSTVCHSCWLNRSVGGNFGITTQSFLPVTGTGSRTDLLNQAFLTSGSMNAGSNFHSFKIAVVLSSFIGISTTVLSGMTYNHVVNVPPPNLDIGNYVILFLYFALLATAVILAWTFVGWRKSHGGRGGAHGGEGH